jgi:hypothetical protein
MRFTYRILPTRTVLGKPRAVFYRLVCYALLKILTGKREMALVQEDIDLIQEMIAKAFVERPESIR